VIRKIPAPNVSAALSLHAKRRSLAALVACFLLGSGSLSAQLAPPSTGGAARLDHLLQRLASSYRVLVIGAHPDDEDTRLLALVAQGYGAEAAYLSLSRGEGGQNLIGDELGVALGLLRSQELVSARLLAAGFHSQGCGACRASVPAAGDRRRLVRHPA
jgi:hypothetical protein